VSQAKDIDIFISTIDQPCLQSCINSIKLQQYKGFSLKLVKNVEPMNEAFNQMIREADKEYFIQVDEDFVLKPHCVGRLKQLISESPPTTVFVCADLYDTGRKRNVQGIKIYRTKLMKRYRFKNVIDCEMDLIRQIEADGNRWLLFKDVVGNHSPDYSPKAAFFRYKSMAEKQRFSFSVYSSDLYELLEPICSDKDRIKLFSILGLIAGMTNPRNVLGRERVKEYYNDVLYDNFESYFNHYRKGNREYSMPIDEPPEVSVIMPLYNTEEKYVRLAVESILNQTYRDFEFIVVLNGSTQKLRDLIATYEKRDNRIRCILLQKPDIRKALNAGIGLARGKYIARQDADDISHLHRLEAQYRYMRANYEIGFCGSDCYLIDMNSVVQRYYNGNPHDYEDIKETLKKHNCFTHGSIMAKASLMKQHLYSLDDSTLHCEDYDLWLRLVFEHGIRCVNLDLPLYSYRENTHGVQRSNFKTMQINAAAVHARYADKFCNVAKVEVVVVCNELGEGFRNRILNYKDVDGNQDVIILDDICSKLDAMGVPYNIDGLDDTHGKLSRYWEYTQAAAAGDGGRVVLDAGSGFSIFPAYLSRKGQKVYSTDYSYKDIREYQAAKLGLDIINDSYTFQTLKYPDEMFDVVYCISCIEHLKSMTDLDAALKQFQRVIRPGGLLIVSFDYHKKYYDFGTAGWKWSESTRYFNWDAFMAQVVPRLDTMVLIDREAPDDIADWKKPPINKHYTFALTAFRKV